MTHPAAAIAAAVSVVAIVAVVGALRLTPDAGTDKLVDNGSPAFESTKEFHDRFGDDAIVVLVEGDLQKLMLTSNIDRLLGLETCLAGRPDASGQYAADVCRQIADLGATRVVLGPATFINEAAARSNEAIVQQIRSLRNASPEQQQKALRQFLATGLSPATVLQGLSIDNAQFVSSIVFDQTKPGAPPKSKFGYLFPSDRGALISIRLRPGHLRVGASRRDRPRPDGGRRRAVRPPRRQLRDLRRAGRRPGPRRRARRPDRDAVRRRPARDGGSVLLLVFGPPLRLLPLLTAIGSAGFAFGLLSLLGGSLTMASVAVLPVVIGLAVDYAIQLQARFREAAAAGRRPPASAVVAAVRGGPVIATAALATAVGFLTLTLSPIPMVREFAIALVAGIAAALVISLTAGLAALSMAPPATPGPARRNRPLGRLGGGRAGAAGRSLAAAGRRAAAIAASARHHAAAADGSGRSRPRSSSPGRVLVIVQPSSP